MRRRTGRGAVLWSVVILWALAGAAEAPAGQFDWARGFEFPDENGEGQVIAAVVFNAGTGPALYAGGNFTMAGGVPANRIVQWNGTRWAALGTGMNNVVRALAGCDEGAGPALYAGGLFSSAGRIPSSYIAKLAAVPD